MSDHFQALQDRIEGMLVLLRSTKSFEDRARMLGDLRLLIDETDRMLNQEPESEPALPVRAKGASAD